MSKHVPEYFQGALDLLRQCYPVEIPAEELPAVLALLRESGMSIRSAAATVGHYYGRPYVDFYEDANMAMQEVATTPDVKARVLDKVREHGYDALSRDDAADPQP
jgi:hypothetical protein